MKAYAAAGLALGLLTGCDDVLNEEQACTQAGCLDGFRVTALAAEELPAGSYEVQVTLDDTLVTCAHSAADVSSWQSSPCSSPSVRSDVVIHSDGSATSDSENAFGIQIARAASVVLVRVLHEGQQIGAATFRPTYQTVMPNGPECGPVCQSAAPEQMRIEFE